MIKSLKTQKKLKREKTISNGTIKDNKVSVLKVDEHPDYNLSNTRYAAASCIIMQV